MRVRVAVGERTHVVPWNTPGTVAELRAEIARRVGHEVRQTSATLDKSSR